MNKVYKVVWNAASGTWSAVSEMARGKGKSKTKSICSQLWLPLL
ncbi:MULTISPECIES: ESPR domain-containing protein [Moraxella]|nr:MULTISPECIES: ESPR domain-containing protein [Moraxella]